MLIRDEEWIVRGTRKASTGGLAVHVMGLSELVRNKPAIFLTELDDVQELRPEATALVFDPSPQYRRSRLYLESLLRRTPPTDARLYVGHTAAMNPAPYQNYPAALALAQPRPRILIADGVGLGKTLEVGILLAELIRRGRGERILVVALKSILAQFQEEMWARFTIPLVRLDSVGLQRVQAHIPSNMNPFYYYDRVIISIDTLKKDAKYRRFLEKCHWDAIVVDECQNVADRSTSAKKSQRASLASLLATTCDALILTSATPHDGRPESFASLMNLLDPTAIAHESDYTQEDIKGLYVRRFKKDIAHEVAGTFHERDPHAHHEAATPAEDHVFEALSDIEFETIDRERSHGGILFRTTLLKAFLSSPQACRATIAARLRQKALAGDDPAAAHDREALTHLDDLVAQAALPSKWRTLRALLEGMGYRRGTAGDRVVIFSERIDTLHLLHEQIQAAFELKPSQVATFHGTLDDQSQQWLVKDFGKADGKTRILLASDAASEGINLHFFCHRIVHFDIPWSLIRLEQRNGRIDRYGQQQRPEIHYLLTVPADPERRGDLRILDRLIVKEQYAHKNLGDAAWLMNLHDADREEDRVAHGIEQHEAPERVIPDEPPPGIDFLDLLASAANDGTAEVAAPLSLYRDDLAYAHEALDELHAADPRALHPPEWHDHLQGLTLLAPEDLRKRFEYLPRELRFDGWEFKLTADRARVQQALEEARQREKGWPQWQLLWDLHPIFQWLNDRVLALFPRNEAPFLTVAGGLAGGELAYVFQGVLSNRRSQPVVVDWFAVVTREDTVREIVGLQAIAARVGLSGGMPNPGDAPGRDSAQRRIPTAVFAARQHMWKLREQRVEAFQAVLAEEDERMSRWYEAALRRLDARLERSRASGANNPLEEKRVEKERLLIERRLVERREWLENGMDAVPIPYLRLAAVLGSRERP